LRVPFTAREAFAGAAEQHPVAARQLQLQLLHQQLEHVDLGVACLHHQAQRVDAVAGPADLRHAVCDGHHLLLLLLYGAGVQQPRNRRQPEEERGVHSGHPPGPADG